MSFAPKEQEQMLHFLQYFQIHDNSKASKGVIMKFRVKYASNSEFIDGETRLVCSCKTSLSSLAVRINAGCSAVLFNNPTLLLI